MNPSQTSLSISLDIPGYLFGAVMLLLVMIFHGVALLQIAKRYEVKTFLYLAEKKYSSVAICFYISVFCLFVTHITEIVIWGSALYAFKLLPALGQSILPIPQWDSWKTFFLTAGKCWQSSLLFLECLLLHGLHQS